jgi:hypothetical protein
MMFKSITDDNLFMTHIILIFLFLFYFCFTKENEKEKKKTFTLNTNNFVTIIKPTKLNQHLCLENYYGLLCG